MRFDHFNISAPVKKLDEVKDFYCRVFGLTVGQRPVFTRQGYWLYDTDNNNARDNARAIIHLIESNDVQQPHAGYFNHLAFSLSDAKQEAFEQKLKVEAIEYIKKQVPGTQTVQLFFYDPAGLRLEVLFNEV